MASKARIDLEARDKASQVFEKVQRSMGDLDKRASALSSGFAGIGKAFGVAGLAGTGLATALAASVKSTADFNDAMGKAAQRAGVTTEAFSKLAYAASLSDVSVEELQKGLQLIGQDAAGGGKKLEELGIQLNNLDGSLKSNDQLLREVADRISRMGTPAEKSAAAVRLLGEEGAKLVPLLNSGAQGLSDMATEAERFGQVVTDDAAKAAAEFNDNLTKIQANVTGLTRQLTSDLIPALAKITTDLLEGTKQADGFFNALVTFGTINPFRSAEGNLTVLRSELKKLEEELSNPSPWRLNTRGLESDIERVRLQIRFLESRMPRSAGGGRGDDINPPLAQPDPVRQNGRGGGGGNTKPPAPKISEAEKYIQSLQRQLEAMDDLTVKEQLLRDIGMGRLGAMTEGQQRDLLGLAEAIDKRRELLSMEEKLAEASRQAADEAQRRFEAERDYIDALLDSTPTGQLQKQREEMQRIAAAFEAGQLSAEEYLEVVSTRLGLGVQESLKETKGIADELGLSFTSAFEDAMVQGRNLSEVMKGLEQDIIRIITRKLVTEPLGNFITGAIGSIIPGLPSFDGGGFTGAGSRMGGLDGKGGYLAMLHPNETVLDHTKGQRMAGQVQNINITVPMPSNGRRETALQFGRDVARSLQMASMRNG